MYFSHSLIWWFGRLVGSGLVVINMALCWRSSCCCVVTVFVTRCRSSSCCIIWYEWWWWIGWVMVAVGNDSLFYLPEELALSGFWGSFGQINFWHKIALNKCFDFLSGVRSYSSSGYSGWAIEQPGCDTSPPGKVHRIESLAPFQPPTGRKGGAFNMNWWVLGSQRAKRGKVILVQVNHLMNLSERKSFSYFMYRLSQAASSNERTRPLTSGIPVEY